MDWRAHIARYGDRWFPGERWVQWTFLALFALGTVLRCWNFGNIPYTHDELSALVRIYPTLWETIQRGVIELDTHPPGVQVFEWMWTKAFGMNEAVVKLPFLVLSLCALFLLYRVALAWTSAPTALAVIALLATLQYTVMYAQIARPYAIGFFTTALLADQLTRYVAMGHRTNLIMTGVAAVLSAYTHHFSLMLAGIMALSGLMVVDRPHRRAYLIMCVCAAAAYLPNIPIFLKQFSLGGLAEWLAAPDRYWLSDHLRWLIHYSDPLAVLTIAVLAVALVQRLRNGAVQGPIRWILPVWGLLPLVIGLAYSIWHAPVLQYSMLLFSFPYVLMALFAGLRTLSSAFAIAVAASLAVLATHSLIFQRHHYELFYASKYEAMIEKAVDAIAEHGRESTLILFDAPEPQLQFYLKAQHLGNEDLPYAQLRSGMTPGHLDSLLRRAKGKVIVVGMCNGGVVEIPARVQARFPYLWERQDLVDGQVMVFADTPGHFTINDRTLLAAASPTTRTRNAWDIHTDLPVVHDGSTGVSKWNFLGREYGLLCRLDMTKEMRDPLDLFEVVVDVETQQPGSNMGAILQLSIADSIHFYRSGELGTYNTGDVVPLVVAGSRSDVKRGRHAVQLATYAHNRAGSPLAIHRMRIFRRTANPVQYGLFGPVYRLPQHP